MLNHKDFPVAPAPNEWPYVYFWHRQGRKDQPCKVTARANVMNSCRVEFPDGYVMITSRNAIRRAKRAGIEVKEMDHAAYGNEFPTIRDLRDRLSELVASGLGELPVQILVVPDSTLQTLARNAGATDDDKPALMIDLMDAEGNSVLIASADRFGASVPDLHRRTLVQ